MENCSMRNPNHDISRLAWSCGLQLRGLRLLMMMVKFYVRRMFISGCSDLVRFMVRLSRVLKRRSEQTASRLYTSVSNHPQVLEMLIGSGDGRVDHLLQGMLQCVLIRSQRGRHSDAFTRYSELCARNVNSKP